MKKMTIADIMADFLDSIRAYERESGSAITYDERGSSEFVNIFFGDGGFKIEEEKPKPLFITDDGVEVFNEETTVYCITRGHNKHEENYRSMRKIESYLKVFFHESSADEYIWRNKPLFSYQDIIEHAYNNPKYRSFIEKLAKERIEQ